MREENFWCKKPRYSEVRVIARRVIARYDCSAMKNNIEAMGHPDLELLSNTHDLTPHGRAHSREG